MGELIKDWATISANTIEALKIMGMGILAIFIVITAIMIVVYILNAVDKKIDENKKAMALAKTAPKVVAETNAIETTRKEIVPAKAPVVPPAPVSQAPAMETQEEHSLEELREPKYRKTGDPYPDSKYRKVGQD